MESHFPLSRCWGARETNRGAATAVFVGMWITVNKLCGSRRGQCRGAEAQACTAKFPSAFTQTLGTAAENSHAYQVGLGWTPASD